MIPNENFSAGLPPPRDDEPSALRRDIVDELADHLHCAVARERLQQDSGEVAEDKLLAAALARFGDPTAVARRLWWDWMKERIMAQRFLSIITAGMAAAAVVGCFLLWDAMRLNNRLQEAAANAQREALAAIVNQLNEPRDAAPAAAAEQHENWYSLRLKLVDEDGRSVDGEVSCTGKPKGFDENVKLFARSTDGMAELGRLPEGAYDLSLRLQDRLQGSTNVLLGPGRPAEMTIVCPSLSRKATMEFDIRPGSRISFEPMYYAAMIANAYSEFGGTRWYADPPETIVALLDRAGKVIGRIPAPTSASTPAGRAVTVPARAGLPDEIFPEDVSKTSLAVRPGECFVTIAAYIPATPPTDEQSLPRLIACTDYPVQRQILVRPEVENRFRIDNTVIHWNEVANAIFMLRDTRAGGGNYPPAPLSVLAQPAATQPYPAAAPQQVPSPTPGQPQVAVPALGTQAPISIDFGRTAPAAGSQEGTSNPTAKEPGSSDPG